MWNRKLMKAVVIFTYFWARIPWVWVNDLPPSSYVTLAKRLHSSKSPFLYLWDEENDSSTFFILLWSWLNETAWWKLVTQCLAQGECFMFPVMITITDKILEKLVILLLLPIFMFFFTRYFPHFLISENRLTHVCTHYSLISYTLSLDKSWTFCLALLFFSAFALTVPSFFLPFFPSRATIRRRTNHLLDLQPLHQWENSYSDFWFYASLVRPPRKHHGILKKKQKPKTAAFFWPELYQICVCNGGEM